MKLDEEGGKVHSDDGRKKNVRSDGEESPGQEQVLDLARIRKEEEEHKEEQNDEEQGSGSVEVFDVIHVKAFAMREESGVKFFSSLQEGQDVVRFCIDKCARSEDLVDTEFFKVCAVEREAEG